MCVGKSSNKITPGKNKGARWQPSSIWSNERYKGYLGEELLYSNAMKEDVTLGEW